MKTIEKAAENFKRECLKNGTCNEDAEQAKKSFLIVSEYALSHQWISVKDELPSENHIWKFDDDCTSTVLCEDSDGYYFFDRMLKHRGEWIWSHRDFRKVKYWMPIPRREE